MSLQLEIRGLAGGFEGVRTKIKVRLLELQVSRSSLNKVGITCYVAN